MSGLTAAGIALLSGRLDRAALALVFAGATLIAVTSAAPKRRHLPRPEATGAQSPLEHLRDRASRSIDDLFGSDAPMARALLIADQHRISPEMRDRYARAGMVHMLSISGLHVAIIAAAVMLLLEAVRVPRSQASLIGVCVTGFYVLVIGAPAPAVRSAVMLAMVAASRATQRPTSPWAGLAVGAAVPLIVPRTVLDLGYQLSVIGIAGLIASAMLARRLLTGRVDGWRSKISRELLASVVATVVTAPIIAWYFGRISVIGPVANMIAGPVIAVLQPMLFAALALAPFPAVAGFVADAAHPLLLAFDWIATTAAMVPGASIAVIPSMVTVVAGGGAVAALVAACVSRYPVRPTIVAGACMAVVAWAPAIGLPYRGGMELHMLDVGQGDALLIRTDRGRWIVVDAGRVWKTGDAGRTTIIPYIMSRGGKVEAFILSHAHADHAGGAESVIRALKPRVFWDSAFPQGSEVYEKTLVASREAGIEWRRVHAGDSMQVDGVSIEFLAPDSTWTASLSDPNEASTVALVSYGSTRFLLVGDAESAEEAWLLDHAKADLRADVLKVAHHGSSTSSTDAFLAAVNPAVGLISVGAANIYGHPSSDVLAALGRLGAATMRTDHSGSIVVRSDGRRLTMEAGGESWDISRR